MEYLIEVMPIISRALTTLKLFLFTFWPITIRDCFSIRIVFAF